MGDYLHSNAQRSAINESDEKQVKFALTAANFTDCIATEVHYIGTVQFATKKRNYQGGNFVNKLSERSASFC